MKYLFLTFAVAIPACRRSANNYTVVPSIPVIQLIKVDLIQICLCKNLPASDLGLHSKAASMPKSSAC